MWFFAWNSNVMTSPGCAVMFDGEKVVAPVESPTMMRCSLLEVLVEVALEAAEVAEAVALAC